MCCKMTIFMQNFVNTMEKFEYRQAVAELERIAEKVEDPATGLDDIERYVRRSSELVDQCRAYLRGVRETVSGKDNG